jgi:hypothetical protein
MTEEKEERVLLCATGKEKKMQTTSRVPLWATNKIYVLKKKDSPLGFHGLSKHLGI